MAKGFLRDFALPLIKGGKLHVGRPVGWRDLDRLQARLARTGDSHEKQSAAEIARCRLSFAAGLLADVEALPLDQASLRLLAAAHNLMVLGHSEMKGRERDQERVAELARDLADVGPPEHEREATARFSLLAHLSDAVAIEHQVQVGPTWLRLRLRGQSGAMGLPLRTLARLPSVQVQSRRRTWWKEIGVPACADAAILALFRACPVLEAMDPLRLHPPLSWRRILPVLHFPSLARAVANRVLECGTEAGGSALAGALLRFASLGEGGEPLANATEAALGVRFVAHVFWLDQLWVDERELDPGCDLASLLAAAADIEPRLLWPPDVSRENEPGARFARTLQRLRTETPKRVPDRYRAMRSLCELAIDQMVSPLAAGRGWVGAPVRR
jgi:hypothetical protein